MDVDRSLLLGGSESQHVVALIHYSSEQCPEDLLHAEPHPNDRTLVKFADWIYTDKNPGESDVAYGERMQSGEQLLNGWRCLMTYNNTGWFNGYFGAAFYHGGQQQVVVAHRGTVPTCTGAVFTDMAGIYGTSYTSCMDSAVTFADNIRQIIHAANTRHKRHYTLTITGHSLGAWLAQITAFSVKYLAIKRLDNPTLFKSNPEVGIQAKTVGFDSPGARDMLNRVLDTHYYRYERNTPRLDGLDITLYLSAPNHINTCGKHIGRIYRIRNNVSNFTWTDKKITYTFKTHAMNNFIEAFKNDNCILGEVLDWAKNTIEFYKLFNIFPWDNSYVRLAWDNNYHAQPKPDDIKIQKIIERYQVVERESPENVDNVGSFRVFSVVELQMLSRMHIVQEQENESKTLINKFIKTYNLNVESSKLLPKFDLDYDKRTIICESGESLVELCKRLKQLMRWLESQFTQAVEAQINAFKRAVDLIYYEEGQIYLDSFPKCWLDFAGFDSLKKFLFSDNEQVLCLVTSSNDVVFQMSRLGNILRQMERNSDSSNSSIKYICKNHYTFVSQSRLQHLVNLFGWPIEKEFLIVVDCTLSPITSVLQVLEDVFKKDMELKNKIKKTLKFLLIVSPSEDTTDSVKFSKTVNFSSNVNFSDLTPDSQNKMFNRDNVITIGGQKYGFQKFLGDDCSFREISQILSSKTIQNFATIQDYAINIKDTRPTLSDTQIPFFKLNIKTSIEFFANCTKSSNTNILVVVSGLSREDLETKAYWHHLKEMDAILAEGDAQLFFRETCKKNQDKCIYLFEVSGQDVSCKEVFNTDFYLARQFLHTAYIDVKKFAETEYADDLFVISSESNKELLIKLIENCKKKQAFTDNILIASTQEEVNVILKHINKRIHFVNICPREENYKLEWRYSHGSVENLLLFMTTDSCEPINETELRKTGRNLTIITDEPGMGKTTTLSSLSRLMDSPWVIYIELKYFQRHIGNKLSGTFTNESVANFLLSGCGSQAKGLLKYLLDSKLNSKRVVLMLDGYDELEDYIKDKDKKSAKQSIIKLLTFIKNIPTVQIFLTARKYLKTSLEEDLCNLCTSFVPFTEEEQLKFLVMIWRSCLSLELGDYGEEEERKLKEYAGEVLRKAKEVLGSDTKCIMGVPLQLRMLAELFRPKSDLNLLKQIKVESTSNLYKKFIALKYDIYLDDKTTLGGVVDELIIKLFTDKITTIHCELGFKTFFPHYNKVFDAIENRWLSKLNRIGLVQTKGDGDFQFIHRTFAEYCCAQMVVHWLNQPKSLNRYELFKEIIVPQILLHPDSKIIRMFLNELLHETTISETALELNAACISRLWNEDSSIFRNSEHQTILHIAVEENNVYIATLLLRGLQIESVQEAFVSLIIQYDENNSTAIHFLNEPKLHNTCKGELVFDTMTTKILEHIGACSDDTKANIFFAILFKRNDSESYETAEKFFFYNFFYPHGIMAPQVSAEEETIIINIFYRVIKKYISCTSRIIHRVKKVESVIKPFIKDVKNNNVTNVQNILFETLRNNVERYCFLLMKHEDRLCTVLHIAVEAGHLDIVRILVEQTDVPFTELMAQRDLWERTPLHTAARWGGLDILEYLVERGADINTRCGEGRSVLMWAARGGELLTVEYLVKRGGDIHATDGDGRTVLHHAAQGGNLPVVEYFLLQGVDPDRLSSSLWGKETALTKASQYKKCDVVRLLLESGMDVNADGGRALSFAIDQGEWSIVEALINKGATIRENQINARYLSEFKEKYPNYVFRYF